MMRTWVPKEVAGVRIPKKVRKAAGRLPKPSPLALGAVASAVVAGILAGAKVLRAGR